MPILTNARHERFAQALAKGLTADAAYVEAGYVRNDGNARRLKGYEAVEARVREIGARAADRLEITVADIVRQLDEDREFARSLSHSAAAVTATIGKAKLLGLVKEKHEHTGKNGGPIEYRNLEEEEIDARLSRLANNHRNSNLAH